VKVLLGLCVLKLQLLCFLTAAAAWRHFRTQSFHRWNARRSGGYLDVAIFHHPTDVIGAFALVGMGATFAGIIRAPMTSVLIIFEMTGATGLFCL